jgi:RNA polymerase sigma-70 factor (ECF subfamily)
MAESREEVGRLLPDARAGSAAALGAALEACRGYLLGIAEGELDAGLRPKGGASDLVQETFLEAQRDFARFHGTTEAELLAWLRRLLLNNLANFVRSYRGTGKRQLDREVALAPADSGGSTPGPAAETPSPSGQVMADEQTRQLQDALARLPEDYRAVLTLRYIEELPFEEIAARLGRTSNAVRKLWARAVERLQEELEGGAPA